MSNNSNEAESEASVDAPMSFGDHYAYVKNLPVIARSIYPDSSPIRLVKKAAVFSLNGIRHKQEFKRVKSLFDCPELSGVLALFPAILEKPFSPYVCVDWELPERVQQLRQHFTYLKTSFGENSKLFYQSQGFRLFDFLTSDNELCGVEMFPGYQCEGSLGLRLVDSDGTEIYTLSMHFSNSPTPEIIIGALQGPNEKIEDRQKKIVTLTKSLHGLRPKALMVEVVYMIATALNIAKIRGISNSGHIYQSSLYSDAKRASIHFNFDELWQEYQADAESVYFYRLPASPVRKDIEALKSKKRSLYRKRYAWLDDIQIKTISAVQQILLEPPESQHTGPETKAA